MDRRCDLYIGQALGIAGQLMALADQRDATSEDIECEALSGVLRDCAYKIRQQARRERAMRAANQGRPHRRDEADL